MLIAAWHAFHIGGSLMLMVNALGIVVMTVLVTFVPVAVQSTCCISECVLG